MTLGTPPGWITLQAKARRAENPEELAIIVNEMNRLLAACEKEDGDHGRKMPSKKKRQRKATKK
jgi:hypothetical protein